MAETDPQPNPDLPPAAQRALAEAAERRARAKAAVLPVELRRYYVVNPGYYGLAVAPAGHAWIYANGSIVLASRTTGVIVRTVPRVW